MTTQAIQTRYLRPTNARGARIKAYSEAFPRGKTVAFSFQTSSMEGEHDAAFRAFATEMEWWGSWVRGASADGRGYVYVMIKAWSERDGLRTPHPQACNPLDLLTVYPESYYSDGSKVKS